MTQEPINRILVKNFMLKNIYYGISLLWKTMLGFKKLYELIWTAIQEYY